MEGKSASYSARLRLTLNKPEFLEFSGSIHTQGGNLFQGSIISGGNTVINQGPSTAELEALIRRSLRSSIVSSPSENTETGYVTAASSIASFHTSRTFSSDDNRAFKQLQKDLHSHGLNGEIFRRYRTRIVDTFNQVIREQLLRENESWDGAKVDLEEDFLDAVSDDDENDDERTITAAWVPPTAAELEEQPSQETTKVESITAKSNTALLDGHDLESTLLGDGEDAETEDVTKQVEGLIRKFGKQYVLEQAVEAGATKQVILLLAKGANASTICLETPCKKGNGKMVVLLVRSGAHYSKQGWLTPMIWAVHNRHTTIARYLLLKGAVADPTWDQKSGLLLLHAVLAGDTALVRAILRAGVDVHKAANHQSETALHLACRVDNSEEMIPILIGAGSLADVSDENGRCPLHLLSTRSSISTVESLRGAGGRIDTVDNYNRSVLYWSCLSASLEIVQYLLDLGADSGQCDSGGRPPLSAILEVLSSSSAPHTLSLHEPDILNHNKKDVTFFRERMKIINLLISKGADPNKTIVGTPTSLHFACIVGCEDLVDALIDVGAKIDAVDGRGRTPLSYAVWAGRVKVIETLLHRDAGLIGVHLLSFALNSTLPEVSRYTANEEVHLHDLRARGTPSRLKSKRLYTSQKFKYNSDRLETLEALLSHNRGDLSGCHIHVKLGSRREYRLHPLLYAAKVGFLDLVACLLRGKTSISTASLSGMTALHYAAEKGHLRVVEYLLAHGADVHALTINGETPLHLVANPQNFRFQDTHNIIYSMAEKSNPGGTVSALASAGVDINAVSAEGYTAFQTAAECRNRPVWVALLIFRAGPKRRRWRRPSTAVIALDIGVGSETPSTKEIAKRDRTRRRSI